MLVQAWVLEQPWPWRAGQLEEPWQQALEQFWRLQEPWAVPRWAMLGQREVGVDLDEVALLDLRHLPWLVFCAPVVPGARGSADG